MCTQRGDKNKESDPTMRFTGKPFQRQNKNKNKTKAKQWYNRIVTKRETKQLRKISTNLHTDPFAIINKKQYLINQIIN